MQNLKNRVQLIGRLGQDPIARTLSNGRSMTTFSLATSESYRDPSGERIKNTQWHNITAWGRTAEIAAEYLKKGKKVAVEGRLVNRQYKTQDGKKHYVTEINLDGLLMVGK